MYIKKEYQNKGIGKILLDKSFEFFDYQDIYLEVVEYNHKAIGFYKKYGFEVVDGRMELYDIGDNVKLPNITMLRKGNKSENSNNIYISKAKEKDAEDIAKFRLEFWYDVYGKIIPGLTMQGVKNRLSPQTQKYIDEIKKQIIDKNNICIIKDKDILVGYFKPGGYYEDGIDAGSIYILSKYQHTGIGTKFIKNFLSDNKDKNIYGEIAKNNKQSIDFCIKNGFIKYSQGGNYEYIDGSSTTYIDCDIYKLNKSENPYSLNDKESDKKSLVPMVFLPILSGKLRRQPDFKEILLNIADLFKFMIGIFQSLWYIYTNKIDVVFCKGGYVALPVVIAAKMLGRKILVHESDTKSGLVNKIAAKFADHIYTGFPGVLAREQVVGQIISDDIVTEDFGRLNQKIPEDKKTTILVNLGSLGSASVHDALMYIFEEYPEFLVNYEWHIILGSLNANYENKYNDIVTAASSTSDNLSNCPYDITTYLFVDQKKMGELLYICDISICRGGTTTLAEQKLFGIKQLIIPIPRTHDQAKNAKYYESHFDDIYIKQDKNTNILGDNIYNEIIGLSAFRKHKTDLDTIISEIQTAKKIICEEIIRG